MGTKSGSVSVDIIHNIASASQARGPGFESRWEHSSFSLKSLDFAPVASRAAFSGMGQASIENNLIYLVLYYKQQNRSICTAVDLIRLSQAI